MNHEVKMLFRLLRQAKLRHLLGDDVRLLPVKREPRQMLTPAEKERLFETASSRPEWQTAYCAALLTAYASMRPLELKRQVWQEVDPFHRLVMLRRSKTDAGARVIPLNEEAWSSIAALKQRTDAWGTYAPECYAFHRLWPTMDGSQPLRSWRTAWRSLRKAAGLLGLQFYDLRHLFVTELCEAGVPESVIRELTGHVDPALTRHYSHPRLAARRAAVEALSGGRALPELGHSAGGYVTNHVTMELPEQSQSA